MHFCECHFGWRWMLMALSEQVSFLYLHMVSSVHSVCWLDDRKDTLPEKSLLQQSQEILPCGLGLTRWVGQVNDIDCLLLFVVYGRFSDGDRCCVVFAVLVLLWQKKLSFFAVFNDVIRHYWGQAVLTVISWSICQHWQKGRRYLRFIYRSWGLHGRCQNTRQILLICHPAWVVCVNIFLYHKLKYTNTIRWSHVTWCATVAAETT